MLADRVREPPTTMTVSAEGREILVTMGERVTASTARRQFVWQR